MCYTGWRTIVCTVGDKFSRRTPRMHTRWDEAGGASSQLLLGRWLWLADRDDGVADRGEDRPPAYHLDSYQDHVVMAGGQCREPEREFVLREASGADRSLATVYVGHRDHPPGLVRCLAGVGV